MLITLSRRVAICQSVAEVQLTGVAPLGAVSCSPIPVATQDVSMPSPVPGKNVYFKIEIDYYQYFERKI